MRELPFHHEPQITALVYAYRKGLKDDETGPEGTVGEYADKLASLSYDELLDRLLVACPENFGQVGLNYLPAGERLQRLMGLAAGHLRAETHWPLIGDFFDSLRSRSQDYVVDFEAASEAIITAFRQRLTAEQQERVRADLIHEFEFADVAEGKRLSPRYIHFTPSGEYYSAWMLHVLGTTVGKLSDLVYPRWLTRPGAINQMLGSTRMHSVMLTLDFRVDARQYWEPTSGNVVDPLGACLYAGPDSPQIVLFLHAIARAAEELERPHHVHELGQLVFLHEFAHLIHLGRSDLDGLLNPAAPEPWSRPDWVELVAQLFTWHAIKHDAKLLALFEAWTDLLPPEYRAWRTLRDCSLEDFRVYLWQLRRAEATRKGVVVPPALLAAYPHLPPLTQASEPRETMKRKYLAIDGTVRTPTAEEHSHPGMARTILGPGWHGDNDDAYAAMWQAGWVRVVETDTEVHGEKYLDGCPVPFDALPAEQQSWFAEKVHAEGKRFIWNSQEFAGSREGQPNAALANRL